MKPFLVLHSAQLFGKWHKLTNQTRLVWLGIFTGGLLLILAQPNLSTTAVCGITIWLIAFAAGIPYRQLMITAGTGLMAAVLSVSIKSYQRDRITSFINPWADPNENGYQLIQSLLAIGSGGTSGTGYGLSAQKLDFLPIQYTDFIFSVFAEEFGFIGGIMLLLFFSGVQHGGFNGRYSGQKNGSSPRCHWLYGAVGRSVAGQYWRSGRRATHNRAAFPDAQLWWQLHDGQPPDCWPPDSRGQRIKRC